MEITHCEVRSAPGTRRGARLQVGWRIIKEAREELGEISRKGAKVAKEERQEEIRLPALADAAAMFRERLRDVSGMPRGR